MRSPCIWEGFEMSSNQCVNWQGNLACIQPGGLVIKSRHTIDGRHVFGPDSDFTTLAVSGLSLLSEEIQITSITSNENIDLLVLQACGYSIIEDGEWTIHCANDSACISITKGDEMDWEVTGNETDRETYNLMESAWQEEMTAVSQGAFVSEQAYRSGAASRMNFSSQRLGDIRIWPPREMIGDQRPVDAPPLGQSGIIESWTKLSAGGAPSEFSLRAPILGGIGTVFVKLNEGPRGVFLIADDETSSPAIGKEVSFTLRRIYAQDGLIRYGLKALIC